MKESLGGKQKGQTSGRCTTLLINCDSAPSAFLGQALGKAFDKKLKKEIAALPSSQLRDYLKDGSTMHGGLKLEAGWLKVEKLFKDQYRESQEFACASNVTSSVLLVTTMDETLIKMGHSREITNRI